MGAQRIKLFSDTTPGHYEKEWEVGQTSSYSMTADLAASVTASFNLIIGQAGVDVSATLHRASESTSMSYDKQSVSKDYQTIYVYQVVTTVRTNLNNVFTSKATVEVEAFPLETVSHQVTVSREYDMSGQ